MTPVFITFEGGEGSGKTTQISLLSEALGVFDIPHIVTREPGGEAGAERIRELLVTGDRNAWDPLAETLLFYAARVQHVNRVIASSLAEGKWVICDRFADSTRVYQGIGKEIHPQFIDALHHLTLGNFKPDLTFILDVPPEEGLKRAASRKGTETRFEEMTREFHEQVRAGFISLTRDEPERCKRVDALQQPADVHMEIMQYIEALRP